jgi:hypothetical protein
MRAAAAFSTNESYEEDILACLVILVQYTSLLAVEYSTIVY